jgi:hypothetical protein
MVNARLSASAFLLATMLALSVLASALLAFWYVQSIRQARRLQIAATVATLNRNIAQALVTEAGDYAKRNPKLEPVLQSLQRRAQGITNSPANRPASP